MADITSEEAKKINENLFGAEALASEEPVMAEEPAVESTANVTADLAVAARIAEFKDILRRTIADKSVKIETPDRNRNQSRIFSFLCKDSKLSAEQCVDKFSATYGGNPTVRDYASFFKQYNISDSKRRADFFNWAARAVGTFVKALETGNGKEFSLYDKCDSEHLYSLNGKSRIFFLMLHYKRPEFFYEDTLKNLEILNDGYAKEAHHAINRWLRKVCNADNLAAESDSERRSKRISDQAQEELEKTRAELKQAKEDLKKLQDKFDGSRSELVRFLSELNSSFNGRILDDIVNAYRAVKNLRKNNIKIPTEIKKEVTNLTQFAINLAQFGHEKRFDYIMDIRKGDKVREMTNGEIEACHGVYHGTAFKNNKEVKRVMITSPGWKYEDKIISPPEFQECSGSEV